MVLVTVEVTGPHTASCLWLGFCAGSTVLLRSVLCHLFPIQVSPGSSLVGSLNSGRAEALVPFPSQASPSLPEPLHPHLHLGCTDSRGFRKPSDCLSSSFFYLSYSIEPQWASGKRDQQSLVISQAHGSWSSRPFFSESSELLSASSSGQQQARCHLPFLDKSKSGLARMGVLRSGLGEWPSFELA